MILKQSPLRYNAMIIGISPYTPNGMTNPRVVEKKTKRHVNSFLKLQLSLGNQNNGTEMINPIVN